MNDKQVLAALRHDLMTLPRAEKLREVIRKVEDRAFGGHYDVQSWRWVVADTSCAYAKIRRNERDRGETLSFRERVGLVEDFKPRRRIGRATSTVRRRHGRLIGSRNSCAESGIEREYHHRHKVERERFAEHEFRSEVRDLDLYRAIEALSEFEYWRFLDYLMGGMSEAQAFVRVRAEIVALEQEELEALRREAMLDYVFDGDLENGDFEDDLETAASYDEGDCSYDPPTD